MNLAHLPGPWAAKKEKAIANRDTDPVTHHQQPLGQQLLSFWSPIILTRKRWSGSALLMSHCGLAQCAEWPCRVVSCRVCSSLTW